MFIFGSSTGSLFSTHSTRGRSSAKIRSEDGATTFHLGSICGCAGVIEMSASMSTSSECASKQADLVAKIIPPLDHTFHKGSAGRIGIIGGCKEYSGAPYFAAISALKVGCDLAHVFCYAEASPVIKSYSPDIIVHPVLDTPDVVSAICDHLNRLHSLVIGPGLGRNANDFKHIHSIVDRAKSVGLPLVFDADALFYVNSNPDIVRGYKKAIITPNVAEFERLVEKLLTERPKSTEESVKSLAKSLGNVTVVLKGRSDCISDGEQVVLCTEPGGPRRCGGQGDILSGTLGVFNYWSHEASKREVSSSLSAPILAALGACLLTKRCNHLAFLKRGRSLISNDMVAEIQYAFSGLFPSA